MMLDELWQLFPVILVSHNAEYADWYETQRVALEALPIDIKRVSHIGSSAVTGLLSKPTVDILLEIGKNSDVDSAVKYILSDGWLLMSDERVPELKIAFNKGYTENGFAEKVYHLHLRRYGDHDELYFREYLCMHHDIADDYAKLKLSLLEKYKHNRDAYTEAKTEFITKYTEKARVEFGNKYAPENIRS